ncbi:MAG: hypothetical protein JWR69_4052 [Pedosphaera sp.]|nr:hypothetical protein [Pedosphaera sp.]
MVAQVPPNMIVSNVETLSREWHTAWCAGKGSGLNHHHRSPEGPDPLGSHDADWEYQGRYLELEKQLLAGASRDREGHPRVRTIVLHPGRPLKSGGARSAAGRGSDNERSESVELQRAGQNRVAGRIWGRSRQEAGRQSSQSGGRPPRAKAVRGFSRTDDGTTRTTGNETRRSRPSFRKPVKARRNASKSSAMKGRL